MGKMHLPPGFRFQPTDVELVKFYLKRKMMGKKIYLDPIAEVDIYKFAPWDLPGKSNLMSGDLKWYFFCRMEKKYASGGRLNRATEIGFWKATGKDRPVLYNSEVAGMIKTLVFHCGKAPKGERTNWVMHEYRIEGKGLAQIEVVQDAYVLCVLFQKDGPGPRNGAQYGAPFKEEDWSDGEDVGFTEPISVPTPTVTALPEPTIGLSSNASALHVPDNPFVEPLAEPCASNVLPLANNMLPSMSCSGNDAAEFPQIPDDDVLSMLDNFSDENFWNGCSQNEKTDYANDAGSAGVFACAGRSNERSWLKDFDRLDGVSVDFYNHRGDHNSNEMHSLGTLIRKSSFLEILDLDAPLDTPVQAPQPDALQSCNHDYIASPSCNHQNHFSVLLHSAESVQMDPQPTPTLQVSGQSNVFPSKASE